MVPAFYHQALWLRGRHISQHNAGCLMKEDSICLELLEEPKRAWQTLSGRPSLLESWNRDLASGCGHPWLNYFTPRLLMIGRRAVRLLISFAMPY